MTVDDSSAFTPPVLERWRRRENLVPGLALVGLAAAGWAHVALQAPSPGSMEDVAGGMAREGVWEIAVFLSAWATMMVAMRWCLPPCP